jgi:hypothetical protein
LDRLYACGDYLNSIGHHQTVMRGASFFVAVVASNDVPYSPPRLWQQTADFGIALGPAADRRVASNRWLSILAGNDLDSSLVIEPPRPLHAPLSEFEIMRRGLQ